MLNLCNFWLLTLISDSFNLILINLIFTLILAFIWEINIILFARRCRLLPHALWEFSHHYLKTLQLQETFFFYSMCKTESLATYTMSSKIKFLKWSSFCLCFLAVVKPPDFLIVNSSDLITNSNLSLDNSLQYSRNSMTVSIDTT